MKYYRPRKEKPPIRIRISIILLFILASFAVCFKFYMEGRGGIMSDDIANDIFTSAPEKREPHADTQRLNPVEASPMISAGYLRSCIVIGNSDIIPSLDKSIETVYVAEGPDSITSARKTVSGSNKELSAEMLINNSDKDNIYLFFDITDTSAKPESIKAELSRFIDSIYSGGKRIYIISSLPSPTADSELNAHISGINSVLLETANECGIYYIDAAQFFRKSDGNLSAAYSDDGKYNAAAAAQTEKIIKTHYVLWYYTNEE